MPHPTWYRTSSAVTLAMVLGAAAARPALAQRFCAPGTLASYAALGHPGCWIGDARDLSFFILTGPSSEIAATEVTPVRRTIGGHRYDGLHLALPPTFALTVTGPLGRSRGGSFHFRADGPRIDRARLESMDAAVAGTAPLTVSASAYLLNGSTGAGFATPQAIERVAIMGAPPITRCVNFRDSGRFIPCAHVEVEWDPSIIGELFFDLGASGPGDEGMATLRSIDLLFRTAAPPTTTTPEPATLALPAGGLLALVGARAWRRRGSAVKAAAGSALLLACTGTTALAQPISPDVVYGRDYTFERMVATRDVRDAQDSGTIRLVSYVYRPVKNDRREVVLFSHGSTGGLVTSPREPSPSALPAPQLVRYFVARGYTVVAPLRRGRNESTGTYVEECSVFAGECTVDDMVALGERAMREALLDTYAVLDQVVLGRLVPRDGKILAAGHSRGGFLSLLLAGERPELVKGVVSFAGGWYGVTDRLTADQNERRLRDQQARLARAAKRAGVPTFWIYAARDPFYREGVPQELERAWRDAGGRAEFVYVAEHALENPHALPAAPTLWARRMDDFLRTLDAPKP